MKKAKKKELFNKEDKHQELAHLIVLKLASVWLEEQDWLRTPYGGQNAVEDFLFQVQLTSKCMWDDVFYEKEKNFSYNLKNLKKQISELSSLSPELNIFFNNRLHLITNSKSIAK